MKVKFLILILLFSTTFLKAQYIGITEVDKSKVTPWNIVELSEYSGVYHFGDSEAESHLTILICDTQIVIQLKSGHFDEDGKWHNDYRNFKNVKIVGNKFYSEGTNGEFVKCPYNDKEITGLKIYKTWSSTTPKGKTEIGYWSHPATENFSGKYPQASYKVLTEKDLKGIKKQELKIMRNEIYARYGFAFKPGGDMDTYFKAQEWYTREYDNVDTFLTEIEIKNLGLIKTMEMN